MLLLIISTISEYVLQFVIISTSGIRILQNRRPRLLAQSQGFSSLAPLVLLTRSWQSSNEIFSTLRNNEIFSTVFNIYLAVRNRREEDKIECFRKVISKTMSNNIYSGWLNWKISNMFGGEWGRMIVMLRWARLRITNCYFPSRAPQWSVMICSLMVLWCRPSGDDLPEGPALPWWWWWWRVPLTGINILAVSTGNSVDPSCAERKDEICGLYSRWI